MTSKICCAAAHRLAGAARSSLVRADPTLLHHVLINLSANAAIHGGEGPITIRGERTRDTVILSVRDRGPGLPAEQETSVFEMFARGVGSDRQGGSGLGLAIVAGFAAAMGLRVSASNGEDGGAVFSVLFPVVETG